MLTEEEKRVRDIVENDPIRAARYIMELESENKKLRKDKEDEEQMFWYLNNEIAKLKRKIDKIKNKGAKNGTV